MYECTECDRLLSKQRIFPSLDDLETHLCNDHFKIFVYECERCPYAKFPTECTLVNHYAETHDLTENIEIKYTLDEPAQEIRRKVQGCLIQSAINMQQKGPLINKLQKTNSLLSPSTTDGATSTANVVENGLQEKTFRKPSISGKKRSRNASQLEANLVDSSKKSLKTCTMENRNIVRRGAKRRRINSSSAVQNKSLPPKMVMILDDTWLEALKHLTCPQWSQIGLVCRQVKGIVQRNISRLPRQVIRSLVLNSACLRYEPSMKHSLRVLLHPASYVKVVEMPAVNQNLINGICNGEERYIRCNSFNLKPLRDIPATPQKIERSLKWLERNVCSDSISFPDWMVNKIHKSVRVREMLTNFIFDTSQKCKAQELVFSFPYPFAYYDDLFYVQTLDVLIKDFLALSAVQGIIPTVVINRYPDKEQYRAQFGKNLIDREVDSQGAGALYVIESGDKRIRISFCRNYTFGEYKVYVKFYII